MWRYLIAASAVFLALAGTAMAAEVNEAIILENARRLIAEGRNPEEVKAGLVELGIDPAELNRPLGIEFNEGLTAYMRGDYQLALKLWRPIAEQGNADAQRGLGEMYANGTGVTRDFVDAVKWYQLAAKQFDDKAQLELGSRYLAGEGVPQDIVLAHMWWNLAAARGNEAARERRDRVASRMTASQIAEAQRLARRWTPAGERSTDKSMIDWLLREMEERCTIHGEVYVDVDDRNSGYGEVQGGSLSCE